MTNKSAIALVPLFIAPRYTMLAQFSRYLITGALAFGCDYGLYVLLVTLLIEGASKRGSGNGVIPINILCCTCGFLVSFLLNRIWVFKAGGEWKKQLVRYGILFTINMIWTNAVLYLMIDRFLFNVLLAKLFIISMVTIVNFFAFRAVVYITR
jgi:putative flippase GtrA